MSTAVETTNDLTCPNACGVAINTRARYGVWGWFALLYGISALPKSVDYVCEKCGRVVSTTKDPAVLQAHR